LTLSVEVKAERTDAWTGAVSEGVCRLEIRDGHDKKPWIYITRGGVTGYESLSVESFLKRDRCDPDACDKSWNACWGTEKRWDGLVVPAREFHRALKELGVFDDVRA
jgi:hypothetical protein